MCRKICVISKYKVIGTINQNMNKYKNHFDFFPNYCLNETNIKN